MATRRNSLRYPGYDYRQPGNYVVTICTFERQRLFGQVLGGTMLLTRSGEAVERAWQDIATEFPGVLVDMHVVMPDHVHGILMLGTEPAIPTTHSLLDLVGWFKNRTHVEYRHRVAAGEWAPYRGRLWQLSCHDRILRNDREMEAYRAYIEGNPDAGRSVTDGRKGAATARSGTECAGTDDLPRLP